MRKILVASSVLLLCVGVAMAEEFTGILKKVDGTSLTITKKGKDKKGEDVTLTAADNIKVQKGKFNKDTKKLEADGALDGGLKNEAVKAGAVVRVTTGSDNKVTELIVGGGKKKKDAK